MQLGDAEDEEKPKNASLLKGMQPERVSVETALKLIVAAADIGRSSADGQKVVAYNGRFGPYIKCGEETRSLPADLSPLDVTFEQALELLAQPKEQRRGFGAGEGAAQGVRHVSGHEAGSETARRALWPIRGRWRDERLAAQAAGNRRGHARTGARAFGGPCGGGSFAARIARPEQSGEKAHGEAGNGGKAKSPRPAKAGGKRSSARAGGKSA